MKVLVIGDTHIHNHNVLGGPKIRGVNQRCRDILDALALNVQAARDHHGVACVVQLGDFFDVARPPPPVVDAAMAMIEESQLPWHILAGNHDILAYGAPTAIAPLGHLPQVRVYEEVTRVELSEDLHWLMVPYVSPDARVARDQAMAEVPDMHDRPDVAFIHYAAAGHTARSDVWPLVGVSQDPADLCIFGHEHNLLRFGGNSVALGAFCDFHFEANVEHEVLLLEGSEYTHHIAVGPWLIDRTLDQAEEIREVLKDHVFRRSRGASAVYCKTVCKRPDHAALIAAGYFQGFLVVPPLPSTKPSESLLDAPPTSSLDTLLDEEIQRLSTDPLVCQRVHQLCKDALQS